MTTDDLLVTVFYCVLVPLVGLAALLALLALLPLLPLYITVAVWVAHVSGAL